MAFAGKIIRNPVTGQDIHFIQTSRDTGGNLLEMETTFPGQSIEPVAHFHPYQEEDFKILQGEVSVRIDGKVTVYHAGDRLHIPPGKVHAMWNDSHQPTIVRWQVRPAMEMEYLLETGVGLAVDKKTNSRGVPNILQAAIMLQHFSDVFRMAKPKYGTQRIIFGILSPMAWLLGYRAVYQKYLD